MRRIRSKKIGLTGQWFGRLMPFRRAAWDHNRRLIWDCLCECGNIHRVRGDHLRSGKVRSCGCAHGSRHRIKDLTGQKFGKLTALKMLDKRLKGCIMWECQCECGNIHRTRSSGLLTGNVKSCGCLWIRHGWARTRLYRTWINLKVRCEDRKNKQYHNYGGRGITYHPSWEEFIPFRDWALAHGYTDELCIDRIDNDGGYEPSNCQWLTRSEHIKKTQLDRNRGAK